MTEVSQDLRDRVASLRMLLLDVDGVLTDGGIILIGDNLEAKRFDVQDGMGINLARAIGLKVGIITSRKSAVVERRAKELKIDDLVQGAAQKTEAFNALLDKYSIQASETAYIGDDIQDLPVLDLVGVPIAVNNAVQMVKDHSVYVTNARGGYGAVREAVEWLLELRGCREQAYRSVTD